MEDGKISPCRAVVVGPNQSFGEATITLDGRKIGGRAPGTLANADAVNLAVIHGPMCAAPLWHTRIGRWVARIETWINRGGEAESRTDYKWNRGFLEVTIQPGDIGFPGVDAIIGPLMMSTRDARQDEPTGTGA